MWGGGMGGRRGRGETGMWRRLGTCGNQMSLSYVSADGTAHLRDTHVVKSG